ncbi:MAG: CUB domain-containing protein [Methanosarcina sp.]|jgi:hypothetical protein
MSERDSLRVLRVLTAYLLIGCILTGNVISACASSETSTDSGYYSNETETSNNIEIDTSEDIEAGASDNTETDISEDIETETRQDTSTSNNFVTESNSLAESDHPYANNYQNTWTIREPGADQIRLHFEYLKLAKNQRYDFQVYDKLILYDKYDNVLAIYGNYMSGVNSQDFWTEWYTGDTLKVKLVTDSSGTANGFIIDKTEIRTDTSASKDFLAESNSLAESDHPYANNYKNTWTISEPGADQIRLHFEYLKLAKNQRYDFQVYDKLILYDKYDNVLAIYGNYMSGVNSQDFWTEWYTGDTLKVKLVTDSSGTANGFKIDKAETRMDEKSEPPRFVDEISSNPSGTSSSEDPKSKQIEDPKPKQVEKTKNENEGKTSASVQLYGEKTDVTLGEDILLRLSAVNLITKPTMCVQVILLPPSGMSVTSSEFVQSGAGQYTTTYELEPGAGKDIEVRIKSNQVGNFDVNGRVIYYFDGDPDNAEDYTLNLPIKVKEETPSGSQLPATDTKNAVQSQNQTKSPGFGSFIAFLGLLTSYTLRKRVP